jgi:hypothetical protein
MFVPGLDYFLIPSKTFFCPLSLHQGFLRKSFAVIMVILLNCKILSQLSINR